VKEAKEEKPALVYRAKATTTAPSTEATESKATPTAKPAAEKPVE